VGSQPLETIKYTREPVLPFAMLAPENERVLSISRLEREVSGVCAILYSSNDMLTLTVQLRRANNPYAKYLAWLESMTALAPSTE
jgi:hypothetical protein